MNLGDEHDYNMPNALFLADVLERSAQSHTQANAAKELRRLYAELERCKQVCAATSEAWREEAALAEPVEPVAWIHTDPDKRRVKFLEWRENEPGYRGDWIKTPLYAAPPRRKPLTEEEIEKLLIESAGMTVQFSDVDLRLARAVERAHGIGGAA